MENWKNSEIVQDSVEDKLVMLAIKNRYIYIIALTTIWTTRTVITIT